MSRPYRQTTKRRPLEVRFWEKVHKTSGCWEWIGAKCNRGYGTVQDADHKVRKTHRVSWRLAHGKIPDGLCVLHHCDNPACVRQNHLFLGTQRDNMQDCAGKGRTGHRVFRGADNPMASLSENDVQTILTRDSDSANRLAAEFGVCRATINNIRSGKMWVHISGRTRRDRRRKLTDDDITAIVESVDQTSVLAELHGVTTTRIRQIKRAAK